MDKILTSSFLFSGLKKSSGASGISFLWVRFSVIDRRDMISYAGSHQVYLNSENAQFVCFGLKSSFSQASVDSDERCNGSASEGPGERWKLLAFEANQSFFEVVRVGNRSISLRGQEIILNWCDCRPSF